jgi:transcriptional regulator of acetoin/glycerol metabolism
MTPKDKATPDAVPTPVSPLDEAVLESFTEGIAVFDAQGQLVYANEHARRMTGLAGKGASPDAATLRPLLLSMGARMAPLRSGATSLGEAFFLPRTEPSRTLADRERQAIVDTLQGANGKLAETARRLGISRTTLWRRLKAYGLRPSNGRGGRGSSS